MYRTITSFLFLLLFAMPPVHAGDVDEFTRSWVYQALSLQRHLGMGQPLGRSNLIYTHNSYNSAAYQNLGSYWDPNHQLSLATQLDLGVRALELDVHYFNDDLKLCHGTGDHVGCSVFDRRFADGLKEVASWLRQPQNRDELVLIYIEEHVDGRYDRLAATLDSELGNLIYRPGSCRTLPMSLTRADVINAGHQVLLMGGNCGSSAWAKTAFNYEFPTGNDSFQPYPACRTAPHDRQFVLNNIVRVFEDSTFLSNTFGDPAQPITPELMAQAMQCSLGVVGMDQLVPFDERLEAAVWSWNPGEPNDWNGNEDCAEQWGNGRFNDLNCGVAQQFACFNPAERSWRVTAASGAWTQGEDLCRQAFGSGWRFDVPKNGYDNQKLAEARQAVGASRVWLNYSDRAREGIWQAAHTVAVNPPPRENPVVWRKLRNDKGKCLDLEDRDTDNGTEIHQWSCHGADSQLWWQDSLGMIHNKSAPDKCIDVSGAGTGEGSRIHLWDCHGGDNQIWVRGPSNSFRPAHAPHMAMDIKDPWWGNGMRAHLWTFHGGKSQRWSWD